MQLFVVHPTAFKHDRLDAAAMAVVRRTPHVRCSRCTSRRTTEERRQVPVAPGLVARPAACLACGATWNNLRGPLKPLLEARERWLRASRVSADAE